MNTETFSVRVSRSTKSRLENLAKSTGRSRAFLAAEAIVAYLDINEWQVAGVTKALSSLDRGKGVAHERVRDWVPRLSVVIRLADVMLRIEIMTKLGN